MKEGRRRKGSRKGGDKREMVIKKKREKTRLASGYEKSDEDEEG